jgi:6-phosphogluconolactonase (cycloisomerase 2 family)
MRFFRKEPAKLFWAMAGVCTLLVVLAGCVISPRRVVVNGPSPTPTPTGTPTPGTTPSTPTPTPTPTPMATAVPKNSAQQFLFAASADSPLMSGFKIGENGSLMPVPGSPFVISEPSRFVASAQGALIVAGENTITAFLVDAETGSIQQTDAIKIGKISQLMTDLPANVIVATTEKGPVAFRVLNGQLKAMPGLASASEVDSMKSQFPSTAVLDASGRFMYVADTSKAELAVFPVGNGKLSTLSPSATYSLPHGAAAIALVRPEQ